MPYKKSTSKKTTSRKHYSSRNKNTTGKGAYSYANPGSWGKAGRVAGSALGRHFAGDTGAAIGEKIGGLAHYVGKLFGSGEYRIGPAPKFNSLFKGSMKPSALSFGDRYVRMSHREYIGDVVTSSTAGEFNLTKFEINPGMAGSFPYLATIARNFQMYRFRGLVFQYVSTSGDALNSTNSALGTVNMVPEYNVLSAAPRSKVEMLNTSGAISGKPSDSLLCGVECDTKKGNNGQFFVRAFDRSANAARDIRLADICNLYVATYGMQGTSVNVGQLYVTYDIDLLMPVTEPPGSYDLTTCIRYDGTVNALPGQWPIPAFNSNPEVPGGAIGTQYPIGVYNPNGIVVRYLGGSPAVSAVCFPKSSVGGYYVINITWLGTVATVLAPTAAAASGCVLKHTDDAPASFSEDYLSGRWYVHIDPETSVWQPSDILGTTWPRLQLTDTGIPGGMTTGQVLVSIHRVNPGVMEACFTL